MGKAGSEEGLMFGVRVVNSYMTMLVRFFVGKVSFSGTSANTPNTTKYNFSTSIETMLK